MKDQSNWRNRAHPHKRESEQKTTIYMRWCFDRMRPRTGPGRTWCINKLTARYRSPSITKYNFQLYIINPVWQTNSVLLSQPPYTCLPFIPLYSPTDISNIYRDGPSTLAIIPLPIHFSNYIFFKIIDLFLQIISSHSVIYNENNIQNSKTS